MEQPEIKVGFVQTKSIMTKSNAPLGGYSVNPYVGCPHACRYCYASFMKRFTGHTEDWGTFMDVKEWPAITNPRKYAGQKVIVGTVTDGYNPLEEKFGKTRLLLEQLKDSGADILICTKSDLVLRDLDLLQEINIPCIVNNSLHNWNECDAYPENNPVFPPVQCIAEGRCQHTSKDTDRHIVKK